MANRVFGRERVIKNLSKYRGDVVKRLVRAVTATQAKVTNDAKKTLRPGYGFITGNLQQSIQPGSVTIRRDRIDALVEANAEYASFVEMGTSRQAAKPFLAPAVISNREFYRKNVKEALRPRGLR